jgi:hypothetical protein
MLKCPEWNDDEIRQLGRGIKSAVVEWRKQTRCQKRRIAWSATVYIASINHINGSFSPIFDREYFCENRDDRIKTSREIMIEERKLRDGYTRCEGCGLVWKPFLIGKAICTKCKIKRRNKETSNERHATSQLSS